MFLVNLEQVVKKEKCRTIECYKKGIEELKKGNYDKETPEHLYIRELPKNAFEAVTKENLQNYQIKPKYGRKSVLIKLLTLFDYSSDEMEKFVAAVKIFLLT